jgi:hypothetical protein
MKKAYLKDIQKLIDNRLPIRRIASINGILKFRNHNKETFQKWKFNKKKITPEFI